MLATLLEQQIHNNLIATYRPRRPPEELALAHLRISLQEAQQSKTKPVAELWDSKPLLQI